MAQIPIEAERLLLEAWRAVGIPYKQGFRADATTDVSLLEVARLALGSEHAVRTNLAKLRILIARRDGERPTPKQIKSEHRDELALGFGYLERSGEYYILGRYGLVGRAIEAVADSSRALNLERAGKALLLYSLLDRHGDCVAATITSIASHGDARSQRERALQEIANSLAARYETVVESPFPAGNTRRLWELRLAEKLVNWGRPIRKSHERMLRVDAAPKGRGRSRSGQAPSELAESTKHGYHSRTVSYLEQLGYCRSGADGAAALTTAGRQLLDALEEQGFASTGGEESQISPSFEAVHDAFSISWSAYLAVFSSPTTRGVLERIVSLSVLSGDKPVPWGTRRGELVDDYHNIVLNTGDPAVGSARLDVVRLALFIASMGRGEALLLDDNSFGVGQDPNQEAATQIALDDPARYSIGRARAGRRFWSVTPRRR